MVIFALTFCVSIVLIGYYTAQFSKSTEHLNDDCITYSFSAASQKDSIWQVISYCMLFITFFMQ